MSNDLINFDNLFNSIIFVFIIGSGTKYFTILGQSSYDNIVQMSTSSNYVTTTIYYLVTVFILKFWLFGLFMTVVSEVFSIVRHQNQMSFKKFFLLINLLEKSSI